jgi:hypothetical protein
MDVRMAAAPVGGVSNLSKFCRAQGISRERSTSGSGGSADRSRRPLSTPGQTPAEVEELVVRSRQDLPEQGWDNGPEAIRCRLQTNPGCRRGRRCGGSWTPRAGHPAAAETAQELDAPHTTSRSAATAPQRPAPTKSASAKNGPTSTSTSSTTATSPPSPPATPSSAPSPSTPPATTNASADHADPPRNS